LNNLDVTTRHLTLEALLWEGFFPELNRLALAHEPVILVIHNNGYVGEKALPLVFANPCLVDLAPAFRIRGARIRAEALAATLERARQVCATGHGPFLIELLEENATHEDVTH
jgi:TPP-dependent pyruvate/acetoin dehydrogenase alpha subunit